jgi:hypothetical protein
MARSDWILPRADSACGKTFHADRRSAEGHRVALEFWNQATGRISSRSSLATYRCKRCGGFHVGRKRTENELRGSSRRSQIAGFSADYGATILSLEHARFDDPAKVDRDGPRAD